jgi:hypothetical protein
MKTVMCDSDAAPHNCLAAGLNKKIVINGVIAKVTAVLAPGAATAAIRITNASAASAEGLPIPAVECRPLPQARSLAEKK